MFIILTGINGSKTLLKISDIQYAEESGGRTYIKTIHGVGFNVKEKIQEIAFLKPIVFSI